MFKLFKFLRISICIQYKKVILVYNILFAAVLFLKYGEGCVVFFPTIFFLILEGGPGDACCCI